MTLIKKSEGEKYADLHFHLLFGCAITMANNGHHASKFHHAPDGGGDDGWICQLIPKATTSKCASPEPALKIRNVGQYVGRVIVVEHGTLDERKSVDFADVRTTIGSQ